MHRKRIVMSLAFLTLCALAACNSPTVKATNSLPQQGVHIVPAVSKPVLASSKLLGPLLVNAPVVGSTSGQQVALPDRALNISNVSEQIGPDASSVTISMTMAINNTSGATITNTSSYFQLISKEGDVFGPQSTVSPSLFGTIAPQASRSGTIVFQVPTAALKGLTLLFHSETMSVMIPLSA
ncbi:MAG: DUF4352 domain-containing protein [Ktedonobacteraceae bacterium]|nr:DUF4352 domain-containing protein [Ktedonobacteraceae bacterium]MBV9020315.1 DUF4352 domain-containing protein [Ktedonobacteraceae bacterium]